MIWKINLMFNKYFGGNFIMSFTLQLYVILRFTEISIQHVFYLYFTFRQFWIGILSCNLIYFEEKQRRIHLLLQHKEGLSLAEIEEFSSHLPEQYLIPSVGDLSAGKCRNFTLIFYNTGPETLKREGAHDEAQSLYDAFYGVGMEVHIYKWDRLHALLKLFRGKLTEIKDTCSFLCICLMAHGVRGMIIDSYGTRGDLNSFFEAVSATIPESIPVVRRRLF